MTRTSTTIYYAQPRNGSDGFYINALHASEECDRLIAIREERS